MMTQIALLRAINVGGARKVAMADLREFFDALGLSNARTLIQTGNVVFESDTRSGAELEGFLEAEARDRLDLDTVFFIRTPDEWDQAIKANPFADRARKDPKCLHIVALKDTPSGDRVKALEAAISGPERVHVRDKHLYIDYLDGAANSKLTNVLIEKKLATRGTARNWNTVLKVSGMAQD